MKKKIIVLKLGGSALGSAETLNQLGVLIQGLRNQNRAVVVVHGGGPAINQELTKRDIQWKFINGQRQTTPVMMEVISKVLSTQVNGLVVDALLKNAIPAVGLSGDKNGILHCSQASRELMRVGQVERVETNSILKVLNEGDLVPIIAPVGVGLRGKKFNVNADWAATQIAVALGADELIFLTDQKGILDQDKNRVVLANPVQIQEMIDAGVISGGMCTKVLAMIKALDAGVKKVRVLHALDGGKLLFTKKIGTLLKGRAYENASGF